MKSIMQEASSVMKAIEKGWEAAGKPQEFSIKIFEEPKKNFIGMTVQSAKISIFFDDKKSSIKESTKPKVDTKKVTIPVQSSKNVKQPTEVAQQKANTSHITVPKKPQEMQPPVIWQPDLIKAAEQWLTDVLAIMNLSGLHFKTSANYYNLVINLNKHLISNTDQEKQLLRSFSILIIQALRHKFKRPLRGFKVILTHSV